MASRQGLAEDLMDFGLRVPPRVGVALAVISWMVFHVVAGISSSPLARENSSSVILSPVIHFSSFFLQYAVPFCLLVGVSVSLIKRRKAKKLLVKAQENPEVVISAMSWRDFERVVGAAFRDKGFQVEEKGGLGPDGGVDLILLKNRDRYLVQCKHWKTWKVGVAIVRELNGIVAAQKASGGFVITGGTFSPDSIEFARSCNVTLIDGSKLREMIRGTAELERRTNKDAVGGAPQCPECGANMIRRIAGRGKFAGQPFWGCSTYTRSKCRGKLTMEQVA